MGVPMEGGTDNTKDPVQQKYNDDGTINKRYIQGAGDRSRIQNLKDTEADTGAASLTTAAAAERRAIKKQNERREESVVTRRQQAIKARNKRTKRANDADEAMAKVRKGFAPYQDRVREAKDKQKKKMKEMKRRSYWEGEK